jgi:hypothetical protein
VRRKSRKALEVGGKREAEKRAAALKRYGGGAGVFLRRRSEAIILKGLTDQLPSQVLP